MTDTADMTTTPHIKAGSGAECTQDLTRETVEAIVAEMRVANGGVISHLADRLQSAHDAEVGALRAELSARGDYVNEQLLSRLREAERDARRLAFLKRSPRDSYEIMQAPPEIWDAAIDRAMEGEDG